MAWEGAPDAPPSARIVSLLPSLQPTERRVAEAVVADRGAAVECTAQDLADTVGVGRTTVIRAAQTLGYDGYPQLRVALAQELALERSTSPSDDAEATLTGSLRAAALRFGARVGDSMSALTEQAVSDIVQTLDEADRVLVIANGLSAPLGLDLMLRLNAAGRPAELVMDAMAQQISARQLGAGSVCVVVSGSGANRSTLDGIRAARSGGARVALITSFARSAAADLSDLVLVVPPVGESFHDELVHTSRVALALLGEQLVELLIARRGDRGREARAASLGVLGRGLQE